MMTYRRTDLLQLRDHEHSTHPGRGRTRGHAQTECVRRDNGLFTDGIGQLEGIERYRRELTRKILSQPCDLDTAVVRPPMVLCRRKIGRIAVVVLCAHLYRI